MNIKFISKIYIKIKQIEENETDFYWSIKLSRKYK